MEATSESCIVLHTVSPRYLLCTVSNVHSVVLTFRLNQAHIGLSYCGDSVALWVTRCQLPRHARAWVRVAAVGSCKCHVGLPVHCQFYSKQHTNIK